MSFRQTINRNPVLVGVATVVVIAALVWGIMRGGGSGSPVTPQASQVYFSSDDGATWVPGSVYDMTTPGLPPRVRVFRCEKDGKEFAGYLERLDHRLVPKGAKPPAGFLLSPMPGMSEVKRPGEKGWMHGGSPAADVIRKVACPSKDGGEVVEVLP